MKNHMTSVLLITVLSWACGRSRIDVAPVETGNPSPGTTGTDETNNDDLVATVDVPVEEEEKAAEDASNQNGNVVADPKTCAELVALNQDVVVENVGYTAGATSETINGTYSALFKINQMTTTLSNQEVKSINSFGVVQGGGKFPTVTTVFRVNENDKAVIGIDNVVIEIGTYQTDGQNATVQLTAGCMVQYGDLSGGQPYLVIP